MHTPGPWTVRNNGNGTLGIDAQEPDGSYCQPARVNGSADDSVYGPTTWANARLIAAAPELLEACREMVADLVGHATFGLNEAEVAMLRRAEAAIARATGGNDD